MTNISQPSDSFAILQWLIFSAATLIACGIVLLASNLRPRG
jgi:hypothetical protein